MQFRFLIDGALVEGPGTFEVINPASGLPFCEAPCAGVAEAELAIAAARRAFPAWRRLGFAKRGDMLARLADALEARREEFARLLTQEQGKPLRDASGELGAAVAALRYYAGLELKPEILRNEDGTRIIEQRDPLGVVAAITPWNYPVLILTQKIGPALITGNCVIAKPAPTTPLTTLLLGELASSILPAGVLQTLCGQNELGALLTCHEGVDFVSFTGSTETGKKVLTSAAGTLKRFSLELGGNDAALVLDDADIEAVAPRIFHGAMKNVGQICLAIKRVYAPRHMMDPLCEVLARLAGEAVLGDGLHQGTTHGPVNNQAQFDKLVDLLAQSRAQGRVVAGGGVPDGDGYFIQPTILRDLPEDSRLVSEEQFGPLLPVQSYDTLDDAIARINASKYGLTATVWTGDPERGIDVASRIESGTVWVNKHLDLPFDIPFGGAKSSGIGRQQGIEGLKEFTQPRIINAAI